MKIHGIEVRRGDFLKLQGGKKVMFIRNSNAKNQILVIKDFKSGITLISNDRVVDVIKE